MADPITPAVSKRICKHMNDDHADAIVLYAQTYGGTPNAASAQMIAIDPQGMDLAVQADGKNLTVRVQFDHTLADSEDAHQTLIAMVRHARSSDRPTPER